MAKYLENGLEHTTITSFSTARMATISCSTTLWCGLNCSLAKMFTVDRNTEYFKDLEELQLVETHIFLPMVARM